MWDKIFDDMATRLIQHGQLEVEFPTKERRISGSDGDMCATIKIADRQTLRALCLRPELALGEGYMSGRITVEGDDLDGLIRLLSSNVRKDAFPPWVRALDRARFGMRRWLLRNTPRISQSNVAHHYDLSNDLYRSFLDPDMQYSCAYFRAPDMTLEAAQSAKMHHIAAKLCLEPDMHVLDIGSGWGGLALMLAREYGVQVTGVTLSRNQLEFAQQRAREAGLDRRVVFRLMDYRDLDTRFDRIVSVGMLEHVGLPQYPIFFDKVAQLLDPDGVALIHSITRCATPRAQSRWIAKYIFPGGLIPTLSELAPAIESAELWTLDIEVLRLHYAMTLRQWRDRFDASLNTLDTSMDMRFVRMWRYYLTVCIHSFEIENQAVMQFQLGHRRDAVPLTRDYLYRETADRHQTRDAAE